MAAVSVIIPTYNRPASLARCLDRLARQDCPADFYEVIVVDDGSTEGVLLTAEKRLPYRLVYHRQANAGSAAARNAGARLAAATILMFLDDDILVEPAFLRLVAAAHEQHPRALIMGALHACLPQDATFFHRLSARQEVATDRTTVPFTECASNNLSIRRTDFDELGGWCNVAGDGQSLWADVEFAYRAHQAGFAFRRVPGAVCYHDDYAVRDLATACRRAEIVGNRAVCLLALHPELIAYLPMFYDMTPVMWGHDPVGLACRKITRRVASTRAPLMMLEAIAAIVERVSPWRALLQPLYRWIHGAYLYRGYRSGLRTARLKSEP